MLGRARGPRWLRVLGRGLTAVVAIAFSYLAIGLYLLGAERGWTGDGPAMLVVMIAIPIAALCALAAWVGLAMPSTATSRVPASLALGAIAIGGGGAAYSAFAMQQAALPSHSAPVVAVAFVDGGGALVSADTMGVVKRWRVARSWVEAEWTVRELAGAQAILVTPEGYRAVALFPDRAVLATFGEKGKVKTLPPLAGAALLAGDRAALAADRTVRVVALADPALADNEWELPAPAGAVAADRQGRVYAALADGTLAALESGRAVRPLARVPIAPVRLLVSPGGTWLAAIAADGTGWVAATATGATHALPGFGVHAATFVGETGFGYNSGPLDGAAHLFSLERLATEPWIGQGRGIAALACDREAGLAAFVSGPDVHVLAAPGPGNAYTSVWERLPGRRP
jgi:hypothetical protein